MPTDTESESSNTSSAEEEPHRTNRGMMEMSNGFIANGETAIVDINGAAILMIQC